MRKQSLAALGAALVLACGVVAWEWYTHVGGAAAPAPVQAVTAAPSPVPASPTPQPVTYVPLQPTASPSPPPPQSTTTPASRPKHTATPFPETPAPTASPTLAPLEAGATPAPREMPMEASTVAPAHVTVPVLREPPDAPPRILSMSLSTPVAHGGETVSGTVETSSNVASVTARIGGYAQAMQKVGVGKFEMSYVVPHLPFFLHRTFMIQVIARNTRGDSVSSAVPITIK